jgi:hypothetical protein
VPAAEVQAYGLQSITNLIVRRRYGAGGPVIALNAHGDVVPPGEGWTHGPYGGEVVDGKLYGRAVGGEQERLRQLHLCAARAGSRWALRSRARSSCTSPTTRSSAANWGPGWLLDKGLTKPDLLIAAGFSYQVVTAHNGCLQMEVTLHGLASHAAYPHTGVDALQAANRLLNALYAHNERAGRAGARRSGITHPYLNVGRIEGGSNTNVVPGKVVLKLDRRMIPEEDAAAVEAEVRSLIEQAVAAAPACGGDQAPAAGPRAAAAARQRAAGQACRSTARRCSASPFPPRARRCTPTCGCTARARRAGGDLRCRAAHRAGKQRQARRRAPGAGPTCAAPPRWSRARCSTCWPEVRWRCVARLALVQDPIRRARNLHNIHGGLGVNPSHPLQSHRRSTDDLPFALLKRRVRLAAIAAAACWPPPRWRWPRRRSSSSSTGASKARPRCSWLRRPRATTRPRAWT